jgi:hypothetical protein
VPLATQSQVFSGPAGAPEWGRDWVPFTLQAYAASFSTRFGLFAEQYLWVSCLRANRRPVGDRNVLHGWNPHNVLRSERSLLGNFYVVETEELGIRLPDRLMSGPRGPLAVDTCYSRREWDRLSELYAGMETPLGRGVRVVWRQCRELLRHDTILASWQHTLLAPQGGLRRRVRRLWGGRGR